MWKAGKLQAVIFVPVAALAMGCSATREYTGKLFKPAQAVVDSQQTALRFLDLESLEKDQGDWVSTDAIRGVDTTDTRVIDGLAEIRPASGDSSLLRKKPVAAETGEPVARKPVAGEVREKRVRE